MYLSTYIFLHFDVNFVHVKIASTNIPQYVCVCTVTEIGEQVIRVKKLVGLPPPALELLGRLS